MIDDKILLQINVREPQANDFYANIEIFPDDIPTFKKLLIVAQKSIEMAIEGFKNE
jgi:hypothetical protein